ncbi:pyrimidine 5'-nucleotidase [Vibrio sonorensis]|uniref:pyrimidine 5'-nucleotidase n=1 Tax=Vibrio sonorensis TaxID=1004316 RepID=UPI0008D96362|nr:pyrimidine 5'-nucleotidase [Vibrio sonorensis]
MKYEWILFDADETLFHFDAFRGMQLMFERRGVAFDQQDFEQYQKVNKPLWDDYQNGDITAQEIKHQRFVEWANKLNTSTFELNSEFLNAMADICTPIPGALDLVESLQGKAKLGIITNGFTELQQIRLQKNGMSDYFEQVIISEEVGVAKPDIGIFQHALNEMGNPCKSKVLMVGDNPKSDVLGGLQFGIETCWLNRSGSQTIDGIEPHYNVSSLHDLKRILLA